MIAKWVAYDLNWTVFRAFSIPSYNFSKLLLRKKVNYFFIKTEKSSIADALPFPDAIDEPENLTANLNATSQNENDENVISNLISALSTHSRPPIQSGLRLVL